MSMNIDFVITWVNGSDTNWIEKRNYWYEKFFGYSFNNAEDRLYRDFGLLKYLFRSIEKYAPWVHKIYLVTDSQIPEWLNLDNKNVTVVDHKDIIPKEYLPVFNSNVIELFIHKIKHLSEHFVYFNDDVLLNRPIRKDFFFFKRLPCDAFIMETLRPSCLNDKFIHYLVNDVSIINEFYPKKIVVRNIFFKIINLKYKWFVIKNIFGLFGAKFSAFNNHHMPQPYLKSVFFDFWDKYKHYLISSSAHKFRSTEDISIYVFRYSQLVVGKFSPKLFSNCSMYTISTDNSSIIKDLKSDKIDIICVNDSSMASESDFLDIKSALEEKFSTKSGFEK